LTGDPTGEPGGFFFPIEIGSALSVAATARGFGFGWAPPRDIAETNPITIHLVPDTPILGRILGRDGRPLEGARVRVLEVGSQPQGEPKVLQPADRKGVAVEKRRAVWSGAIPDQPQEIRTGTDGRFRLEGAGSGRVVRLAIDGPDGLHSDVTVFTGNREDAAMPEGKSPTYGAVFDHRLGAAPESLPKP
jgi:hypothetical protein